MGEHELSATVAAGRALRSAGRVDRSAVSASAGLIAAIPVAGALALGTAVGQPVAAVTMAVGAMLSGVAWRASGGPAQPPVATMSAAAAGLVIATVTGTLSGRWPWLHLVALTIFCLLAGLMSALGRRGGVVGTQSVIAFVVFGRFPEPVGPAFALAGLVALGAAMQIVFATLVALPPAWRRQRGAVADAYDRLADVARLPGASSLAAGTALDLADERVSAPALLADPAVIGLADLVQEGRRMRLWIGVLWQAGEQLGSDDEDRRRIRAELGHAATILGRIAATVRDPRLPLPELDPRPAEAGSRATSLLCGLDGQLAAALRMAELTRGRASARARAHPNLGSRLPLSSLGSDLRRLRAAATLDSAAGRHAVRLAVVVAGTELLTQRVALPRGYWAVVAAATVLRPEFSATITRGAERVGGTSAGVVLATLIAVALAPGGWGITAIVALLAIATYAVFPASFAAGTAGLTAVVVFLLHAVAPDSATIALDRGIDTVIGGGIGLAAYLLWPTWSGSSVTRLLADLADAQRAYLVAVLASLQRGAVMTDEQLRPLARRARVAYGDAEAAVTLTRNEPPRGTDPGQAVAILGALRRLVYGVHTLRLEGSAELPALPELGDLRAGFDRELGEIAQRLRGGLPASTTGDASSTAALRPLRGRFERVAERLRGGGPVSGDGGDRGDAIRIALDELVDATNTVAELVGLEVSEPAKAAETAGPGARVGS